MVSLWPSPAGILPCRNKSANTLPLGLGSGHTGSGSDVRCGSHEGAKRCVVLLRRPNCSQSGWGDTTAASVQTQWGDATARWGSTTLVAASLGVCPQPERISHQAVDILHISHFRTKTGRGNCTLLQKVFRVAVLVWNAFFTARRAHVPVAESRYCAASTLRRRVTSRCEPGLGPQASSLIHEHRICLGDRRATALRAENGIVFQNPVVCVQHVTRGGSTLERSALKNVFICCGLQVWTGCPDPCTALG